MITEIANVQPSYITVLEDVESGFLTQIETLTHSLTTLDSNAVIIFNGSSGFNFTQTSPSTLWTIAHNLGQKPIVDVFSVGGVSMYGTVQHISDNVLNINFNTAVAGYARLN